MSILPNTPAAQELPQDLEQFFDIPGIVIEHVRGCILGDLGLHAPPTAWQRVCEEAIRVVNLIGEYGLLNEDVKTRNVLVRTKDPAFDSFGVVFIDFGHCRFRQPEQPEAEWVHEKTRKDEEGAIGCVMQGKLKGGFVYVPTERYHCLCRRCTEPY
jgi:hypothetical protein